MDNIWNYIIAVIVAQTIVLGGGYLFQLIQPDYFQEIYVNIFGDTFDEEYNQYIIDSQNDEQILVLRIDDQPSQQYKLYVWIKINYPDYEIIDSIYSEKFKYMIVKIRLKE